MGLPAIPRQPAVATACSVICRPLVWLVGKGRRCGKGVRTRWGDLFKKNNDSGVVEVAEVAHEVMVNQFCRNGAEQWGKKTKTLRKVLPIQLLQQDLRRGNTVCIRATKMALISTSGCHRPGQSPRRRSGRARTSSGLWSIPRGVSSQPWQRKRWNTAPCCDLSKITWQTSAKIEHCLLMPLKKKKCSCQNSLYHKQNNLD